MASVNKVILIGNCGRDPEVRYSADGAAIANVSIATTSRYKDKASGEYKEETEWHRVSFFGRTAEVVGEYVKKGKPIYVEGRLRTRKYTDKDGVERSTTEIIADSMQLLGGGRDGGGSSDEMGGGGSRMRDTDSSPRPTGSKPSAPSKATSGFDSMDDDIPF